MRYVAHDEHFHSGPMAKPNLVNYKITEQTTGRELVLLQELQRQLWREFSLQVAVDRAGLDIFAAVVNKQYTKEKRRSTADMRARQCSHYFHISVPSQLSPTTSE